MLNVACANYHPPAQAKSPAGRSDHGRGTDLSYVKAILKLAKLQRLQKHQWVLSLVGARRLERRLTQIKVKQSDQQPIAVDKQIDLRDCAVIVKIGDGHIVDNLQRIAIRKTRGNIAQHIV